MVIAQNIVVGPLQRLLVIGTSALGQVLQNMRWIDPAPQNGSP